MRGRPIPHCHEGVGGAIKSREDTLRLRARGSIHSAFEASLWDSWISPSRADASL